MLKVAGAVVLSLLLQTSNAETRIVEYLKTNVVPGRAVVVSDLYNNVFKTPEERKVLDRLYSTFFKLPMFSVQPHLMYFWFTNCPPCVKTSPILTELYNKYAKQGFKIVGANADKVLELPYDDKARADYAKKYGFTFTLAHLNGETQQAYGGVSVFPTMFFVDKTGTIVRHFVNFQEKPVLEAAIQQILGK